MNRSKYWQGKEIWHNGGAKVELPIGKIPKSLFNVGNRAVRSP